MTASTTPTGPAAGNRRTLLVLLAVLVVLVGLAVGLMLWTSEDRSEADLDAEQACEITQRLPEEITQEDVMEGLVVQYRIGGVYSLAMSAAERDEQYAALLDAVDEVRARIVSTRLEDGPADVSGLHRTCDGIASWASSGGSDAEFDAEQACRAIERLPEDATDPEFMEDEEGYSAFWGRLGAAANLAQGAAEADSTYAELSESIVLVHERVTQTFSTEDIGPDLADAREECSAIS